MSCVASDTLAAQNEDGRVSGSVGYPFFKFSMMHRLQVRNHEARNLTLNSHVEL